MSHIYLLLFWKSLTQCKNINSCCLNDFVRLLEKYDVMIKLKDNYIPQIQRENDMLIMENILTNSSALTIQKEFLTYWLYLEVIFLSDFTNLKGYSLLTTNL